LHVEVTSDDANRFPAQAQPDGSERRAYAAV